MPPSTIKLTLLTDKESLEHAFKTQEPLFSPTVSMESTSDVDSLFDEPMDDTETSPTDILADLDDIHSAYTEPPRPTDLKAASRTGPPIHGLYFDPSLILPEDLAESLFQKCIDMYFAQEGVNQVMLFERVAADTNIPSSTSCTSSCKLIIPLPSHKQPTAAPPPERPSSLPPFLTSLLHTLASLLQPLLPPETHALLFPPPESPPQARQVIVNFYRPGEGITPHVDLLERFGDGIAGVSLGSGCVMRFRRAAAHDSSGGADVQGDAESREQNGDGCEEGEDYDVFLPHGSVYVMSGEARYRWTHGIEGRTEDWVQDRPGSDIGRWVMRSIRVSITFRWLLPGADVVGGLPEASAKY